MSYTLLQKLENDLNSGKVLQYERDARQWLKEIERASQLGEAFEDHKVNIVKPGHVYFFVYDPKGKKELSRYDIFPMCVVIRLYKDGWLGLNMHYLPPRLRAKVFDTLQRYRTNDEWDENTKLKMQWRFLMRLAKAPKLRFCVKRYLRRRKRSKFIKLHSAEWYLALFLPYERFKKQKKMTIWNQAKKA